jgi:hypothetical protein
MKAMAAGVMMPFAVAPVPACAVRLGLGGAFFVGAFAVVLVVVVAVILLVVTAVFSPCEKRRLPVGIA